MSGVGNSAVEQLNGVQSTQYAIILFCVSAGFFFLSTLFLPTIVLSPYKFAFLFSTACLCSMASLAAYYGLGSYIKSLLKPDKILFSIAYIAALVSTIFCSMILGNYFLTLISCVGEFFAMGFFVCSGFPGGVTGMKMFSRAIFSAVGNCCKSMFTRR